MGIPPKSIRITPNLAHEYSKYVQNLEAKLFRKSDGSWVTVTRGMPSPQRATLITDDALLLGILPQRAENAGRRILSSPKEEAKSQMHALIERAITHLSAKEKRAKSSCFYRIYFYFFVKQDLETYRQANARLESKTSPSSRDDSRRASPDTPSLTRAVEEKKSPSLLVATGSHPNPPPTTSTSPPPSSPTPGPVPEPPLISIEPFTPPSLIPRLSSSPSLTSPPTFPSFPLPAVPSPPLAPPFLEESKEPRMESKDRSPTSPATSATPRVSPSLRPIPEEKKGLSIDPFIARQFLALLTSGNEPSILTYIKAHPQLIPWLERSNPTAFDKLKPLIIHNTRVEAEKFKQDLRRDDITSLGKFTASLATFIQLQDFAAVGEFVDSALQILVQKKDFAKALHIQNAVKAHSDLAKERGVRFKVFSELENDMAAPQALATQYEEDATRLWDTGDRIGAYEKQALAAELYVSLGQSKVASGLLRSTLPKLLGSENRETRKVAVTVARKLNTDPFLRAHLSAEDLHILEIGRKNLEKLYEAEELVLSAKKKLKEEGGPILQQQLFQAAKKYFELGKQEKAISIFREMQMHVIKTQDIQSFIELFDQVNRQCPSYMSTIFENTSRSKLQEARIQQLRQVTEAKGEAKGDVAESLIRSTNLLLGAGDSRNAAKMLNERFTTLIRRGDLHTALTFFAQIPLHMLARFKAANLSLFPVLDKEVAKTLPPGLKKIYYIDIMQYQNRIVGNPVHLTKTLEVLPGLPDLPPRQDLNLLPKKYLDFLTLPETREAINEAKASGELSEARAEDIVQGIRLLVEFAQGRSALFRGDERLLHNPHFLENLSKVLKCIMKAIEDPPEDRETIVKRAKAFILLAEGGIHCAAGNLNTALEAYHLLADKDIVGAGDSMNPEVFERNQRKDLFKLLEQTRMGIIDDLVTAETSRIRQTLIGPGITERDAERKVDPVHVKIHILKMLGNSVPGDVAGLRLGKLFQYDDHFATLGGSEYLSQEYVKQRFAEAYSADAIINAAVANPNAFRAAEYFGEGWEAAMTMRGININRFSIIELLEKYECLALKA